MARYELNCAKGSNRNTGAIRVVKTRRAPAPRNSDGSALSLAAVRKNAISRKWCFDHVVFYLDKILELTPAHRNRLIEEWDL